MLVEIQGIKYYEEEVVCETGTIEKEAPIKPKDIFIDNVAHEVTFKIKDTIKSETECDIRLIAECKKLKLQAESDTIDVQKLLTDIYNSIIENQEIESSDFISELKDQVISRLFEDIAKESLIEKVAYNNLVMLEVNGELIGTASGFMVSAGNVTLTDIDTITEITDEFEIHATTFISATKKIVADLVLDSENKFISSKLVVLNEAVDEKLLNQKHENDFIDREEYMEYRRSLVAQDLTEDLYEMDFDDFM